MTRIYSTERSAHRALIERSATIDQTRADWRAVLSARDAKRAARRQSLARHSRQSGHVGHGVLLALILICAGALAYLAWDAARGAIGALQSHHSAGGAL